MRRESKQGSDNMSNDKESRIVFREGKYGLILDGKNWMVAQFKDTGAKTVEDRRGVFLDSSYSYHANIQQAIINMANRMQNDRISEACRNKILNLKELASIMQEKDAWMRKTILGRSKT